MSGYGTQPVTDAHVELEDGRKVLVREYADGAVRVALDPVPGATGYDITEGFLTGGGRQAIIKLIAMVPGNGLA